MCGTVAFCLLLFFYFCSAHCAVHLYNSTAFFTYSYDEFFWNLVDRCYRLNGRKCLWSVKIASALSSSCLLEGLCVTSLAWTNRKRTHSFVIRFFTRVAWHRIWNWVDAIVARLLNWSRPWHLFTSQTMICLWSKYQCHRQHRSWDFGRQLLLL